MKDYAPKLAKVAEGVLQSGERLLAAVRTQPAGGAARAGAAGATTAAVGGVAGVAFAAAFALKAARDADRRETALTLDALHMAALGLTDRRLLVWSRSRLTGRPGTLLGELPFEWIRGLGVQRGGLAHHLGLELGDGTQVVLEVFRGDDVEHFAEAFHRVRPTG